MGKIGLLFSLFDTSLSGFYIRIYVASKKVFSNFTSVSTVWNTLKSISISSSNVWKNTALKVSGPEGGWFGVFFLFPYETFNYSFSCLRNYRSA